MDDAVHAFDRNPGDDRLCYNGRLVEYVRCWEVWLAAGKGNDQASRALDTRHGLVQSEHATVLVGGSGYSTDEGGRVRPTSRIA